MGSRMIIVVSLTLLTTPQPGNKNTESEYHRSVSQACKAAANPSYKATVFITFFFADFAEFNNNHRKT